MNIDKQQIKANAWESITNCKPTPFIATIIMLLLSGISSSIQGDEDTPFILALIAFIISIVVSVIGIGYQWYCLNVARNQSPEPLSILEIFTDGKFGKVIKLWLLMFVKILLWSLLFVVPGIIKAYSYSQSFYILYDNPTWTASQCMEESARMMQGNKFELFLFNLSFIGWGIVACLVCGIVIGIVGVLLGNVGVIFGYLALAPFYAYMSTALAGYYNALYMHMYNQY